TTSAPVDELGTAQSARWRDGDRPAHAQEAPRGPAVRRALGVACHARRPARLRGLASVASGLMSGGARSCCGLAETGASPRRARLTARPRRAIGRLQPLGFQASQTASTPRRSGPWWRPPAPVGIQGAELRLAGVDAGEVEPVELLGVDEPAGTYA